MAKRAEQEIIDVLYCNERNYLTDISGEQPGWLLGKVPVQHKIAHKLRDVGFDMLSGHCKRDKSRFSILTLCARGDTWLRKCQNKFYHSSQFLYLCIKVVCIGNLL